VGAVCIGGDEAARSLLEAYENADNIPKAALQEVAQRTGVQDWVVMDYCRRAEHQQNHKGSFSPEKAKTE
jgi:hypothetical protein